MAPCSCNYSYFYSIFTASENLIFLFFPWVEIKFGMLFQHTIYRHFSWETSCICFHYELSRCNKIKIVFFVRISASSCDVFVQVFCINYGNTEAVKPSDLWEFSEDTVKSEILEVPFQAFECILSEIQPSLIHNSQGLWTEEAQREFRRIVQNKMLYGKVGWLE